MEDRGRCWREGAAEAERERMMLENHDPPSPSRPVEQEWPCCQCKGERKKDMSPSNGSFDLGRMKSIQPSLSRVFTSSQNLREVDSGKRGRF